ncbi:MerR family transcriptional regulator [Aureimonas leprariae]|uniref:MerR family transcriptional regulator n=1 Tax=Plantimonas leprariae TaxID=2615207 RepID=A0A7V7PML7_9HYPH|nr:MerR family transcriptional regulator [Aureimonas leprariae]KAB0678106.1 MerR family transcriptional regulator [Aureimonas leprariae]
MKSVRRQSSESELDDMEDPADEGDRRSSDDWASLTQILGLNSPAAANQPAYRADELARQLGTDPQTLHRYESLGLLRPVTGADEPLYSNADRTRMRIALLGELLGISSEDVLRLAEHYTARSA